MSERRALPPKLYALTPGDATSADFARIEAAVSAAARAGLAGVLLREPELSDRDTLALATRLRRALGRDGYIGLHDRAHLARALRVEAVHLGFRSLEPRVVRTLLPVHMTVGWSAHARDDLAVIDGVDYAFFGPVLETPSKKDLVDPVGFDRLRRACAASPIPLWAIGGITPENAREAILCGAHGVAVRAGIFGAEDPARAVENYLAALR